MTNIDFNNFLQTSHIRKTHNWTYVLSLHIPGKHLCILEYDLKYQRITQSNITNLNPGELMTLHYKVLRFHNKLIKTKSNIVALNCSEQIGYINI